MAQTITEKIFSEHVGSEVRAGQIIESEIDMTIGNDITTPISIRAFKESGAKALAKPENFAIVMDHYIPAKDIMSANQAKISRDFAAEHDLKYFFDEKDMGIEHALIPEKGLVSPGDVVIGADSHTCTHGALGLFSTGMGSTDLAYAMITGKNWFKVPATIKVDFKGKPGEHVYGKDLILEIIRQIGVDGALYQALEFTGEAMSHIDMDGRFSLCNMAIEAGGKNGIIAVDEITKEFLSEKNLAREPRLHYSDEGANYARVLEIDVSKLDPVIAYPFLPSNGKSVRQAQKDDIKIDQAFIGSCTNGRIEDFRIAAEILKGKRVAKNVKAIAVPGSVIVKEQAEKEGLHEIFIDAGFEWRQPGCSMCLAMNPDKLVGDQISASTSNRNFKGRQGSATGRTMLLSPAMVAAAAVEGAVTDVRDMI